ncbi:HNH endonuclease [Streptomyces melanogenes]|uniref:HNH endonuclease n=1 Tax=Streptomyces melanogenes TaxID=67326 RepID=UPI00379D4BCD
MNSGDRPSWQDGKRGSMVRCALWLLEEVGVGNVFTKTELREAFPETSQIDRRVRDLRDRGWKIATNREDPLLKPHEQRFVEMGAEVWKPGQSKALTQAASITANQRREVFDRDGYLCRVCGIAAGEVYDGGIETAQLDIARREVRHPGGGTTVQLVTECRRCRVGGRDASTDLADFLGRLRQMSSLERDLFAQWVAEDRREFSLLDRLWAEFRTLPLESRSAVEADLGAG